MKSKVHTSYVAFSNEGDKCCISRRFSEDYHRCMLVGGLLTADELSCLVSVMRDKRELNQGLYNFLVNALTVAEAYEGATDEEK